MHLCFCFLSTSLGMADQTSSNAIKAPHKYTYKSIATVETIGNGSHEAARG